LNWTAGGETRETHIRRRAAHERQQRQRAHRAHTTATHVVGWGWLLGTLPGHALVCAASFKCGLAVPVYQANTDPRATQQRLGQHCAVSGRHCGSDPV